MGLDTTHDAFHGAYSSFMRFREGVITATGGRFDAEKRYFLFPEGYERDTHPGLFEFMSHSDCDGEISPEMCAKIADELEALLPAIEKVDGFDYGHISRDGGLVAVTKRFIEGCRKAASANEPLEFR